MTDEKQQFLKLENTYKASPMNETETQERYIQKSSEYSPGDITGSTFTIFRIDNSCCRIIGISFDNCIPIPGPGIGAWHVFLGKGDDFTENQLDFIRGDMSRYV